MGAGLGSVLVVGHVADPVQAVLDGPVPADDRGQFGGAGLGRVQRGDRVDGLGRPSLLALEWAPPAHDLDGLDCMWEHQSGLDSDLQGPSLDTSVAAAAAAAVMADRDVTPGQRFELGVQVRREVGRAARYQLFQLVLFRRPPPEPGMRAFPAPGSLAIFCVIYELTPWGWIESWQHPQTTRVCGAWRA